MKTPKLHKLEKATEIASIVIMGATFALKIAGLFGGKPDETE